MKKSMSFAILSILFALLFSTAYGADRVVVIPLGKTGVMGPAGGGVQVYDANNQYLGILLTFIEQAGLYEPFFTVFNPILNIPVAISKRTGKVVSLGDLDRLWYAYYINSSTCGGIAAYVKDESIYAGILFANSQSSSATYPYISVGYPPISVSNASVSRDLLKDSVSCENWGSFTGDLSPLTYYTKAEVPITFPIAFPLRFQVSQ